MWRWEMAANEETVKEQMLKLRFDSGLSYLKAQVKGGSQGWGGKWQTWHPSKKYWRIVTKNA